MTMNVPLTRLVFRENVRTLVHLRTVASKLFVQSMYTEPNANVLQDTRVAPMLNANPMNVLSTPIAPQLMLVLMRSVLILVTVLPMPTVRLEITEAFAHVNLDSRVILTLKAVNQVRLRLLFYF